MTESNEIWMETDYQTEGVRSLEMAIEQLGKVLDDAYRWKWTIVAIHNALQAFMVAAVSGSDLLGAMTEEYAKHWYTQHEKGERPTQPERLASFAELFARIQQLKGYVDSQSLHPTPEQTRSVRALNRWRDDFVHYKPGSLSIEVSGYPGITRLCLEVVRFIAFDSHHVFRVVDDLSDRTERALEEAGSLLDAIERAFGPLAK